ncbi:MAG: porin family protein [Bacteroidota bacterium]
MFYKITLLLFSVLLVGAAYGQNAAFGIKGGPSVTAFGGLDNGFSPRLAYHAGLFTRRSINEKIKTQTELTYSLQGAQDQFISEFRFNYSYVNLAMLVNVNIGQGIFVDLGGQGGYLVSAKSRTGVFKDDVRDNVNKWDYALVGGLSYYFNERVSFAGRYNYGLRATATGAPDRNSRFPNRVFQFTVFYVLGSKGNSSD